MLRGARRVASKDLRLEWRSRVALGQIVPFALVVLVTFAFAVDADTAVLRRIAPGLLWVSVLLASLLAVARSTSLESADGLTDAVRLTGMAPASFFLGRSAALAAQLLVVEGILVLGIVVLYDASVVDPVLFVAALVPATVALAAIGTLYGALSLAVRVRETLVPLLVMPAAAPVLLGASRAHERAMGLTTAGGWAWVGLLTLFGVVYVTAGIAAYGPLLEDS